MQYVSGLVFVHRSPSNVGEIRPCRYVGGPISMKGPSRGSSCTWSLLDFLTFLRRTSQINGDTVCLIYRKFSLQFGLALLFFSSHFNLKHMYILYH